jgi:hypothetical protein
MMPYQCLHLDHPFRHPFANVAAVMNGNCKSGPAGRNRVILAQSARTGRDDSFHQGCCIYIGSVEDLLAFDDVLQFIDRPVTPTIATHQRMNTPGMYLDIALPDKFSRLILHAICRYYGLESTLPLYHQRRSHKWVGSAGHINQQTLGS